MKMQSLKMPKMSKKEMEAHKAEAMPAGGDGPHWPYGTRISIEGDTLKKFPEASDLEVGAEVTLQAKAVVIRKEITEVDKANVEYGSNRTCVELQLTDLALADSGDYDSAWKDSEREDE